MLTRQPVSVNLVNPVRRCRYMGPTLEQRSGIWERYIVTRRGLLILPLVIAVYAVALGLPSAQAGAEADFIRKLGGNVAVYHHRQTALIRHRPGRVLLG